VAISGEKGEEVEDLQKIYAAMAGIDVSEIPEEMANDAGALADAIAKMDMAEKHKEAMEDFRKNMEKLSEED
jgi:hypothetical protein